MENNETKNWNAGGLYLKEANGKKFFSGSIRIEDLAVAERDNQGRVRIAVFRNERKEKESHPDYNVTVKVPSSHGQQKKDEQKVAMRDRSLPF